MPTPRQLAQAIYIALSGFGGLSALRHLAKYGPSEEGNLTSDRLAEELEKVLDKMAEIEAEERAAERASWVPPYPGKPPFDLVRLSTLPVDQWKGQPVFHPGCQVGDEAAWRSEDDPFFQAEPDEHGPADEPGTWYDVGVVVRWETENWRQEPDNPDAHEVYFLTGHGHTLHYGAGNLWTPRPEIGPGTQVRLKGSWDHSRHGPEAVVVKMLAGDRILVCTIPMADPGWKHASVQVLGIDEVEVVG